MRVKVTPLGPIASSPSAMNRNDAPQMSPGIAMSDQSDSFVLDMSRIYADIW